MDSNQVQIQDKAVCVSICVFLPPAISGWKSIALVRQPIQKKENPEFKPAVLCLKSNIVLQPACYRKFG